MTKVVEKASGRVPGRAPGSSQSRVDDGGGDTSILHHYFVPKFTVIH
jgi:hypothetical protein